MNYSRGAILLFVFSCVWAINLQAQSTDSKNNRKNSQDSDSTGSSILVGVDYFSNTNILGIYPNDLEQPSISPMVSFYGKSGLFLTGTTLFIQNADTSLSTTATEFDFQAGYRWDITPSLSLTPSYVHFLYGKNMNTLRSVYSDYADLSFDAQSKWVFGTVSSLYVIGNQSAFILNAQAGLNVQVENFLGHDHTLLIQPAIDLDFNNQEYYHRFAFVCFQFLQTYADNHPGATVEDFKSYYENHLNTLWGRGITRYLNRHPKIDKAYNKLAPGTVISNLFDIKTKFTLSSVGLTIPISYSFQNLIIKLSVSGYKPLNQPAFMESNWSFMCSLGVNYTFNW